MKRYGLKKGKILLGSLCAAILVLAVLSSSALALEWEIESKTFTELALNEEAVTPALQIGTQFVFETKVLGKGFKSSFREVVGTGMKLNRAGTGSGQLEFRGVTVQEPTGCKVTAPLKTPVLTFEAMKVGTSVYERILPPIKELKGGRTIYRPYATMEITGCAWEGSYAINTLHGLYAELEPLKTQLVSQPLRFSPAINTAGGGDLTMGPEAAKLTGNVTEVFAGPNAGKKFGLRE